MEHQVMEYVLVENRRNMKNGSEDDQATEQTVVDPNEVTLHTATCPEGCCKFVSRYLLKAV